MTARRVVAGAAIGVITALLGAVPAAAETPTGSWAAVAPTVFGSVSPSAATLPDGRVVLAGGAATTSDIHQFSDVYDPASDSWSTAALTQESRVTATAVALKNGKVLVVGGENAFNAAGALDTAEIYDPATNAWAAVPGVMQSARAHNPVAIVLTSGKVLIAGGSDTTGHPVSTADLYDPATNAFVTVGRPPDMGTARQGAAAALLTSGKVLVAGGTGGTGSTMLSSAEVYDPVANTWTAVSNTMTDPRGDGPGAATLRDGRVLVMGGTTTRTPFAVSSVTADLYNPATNAFSAAGSMRESRTSFAYAPLADGRVLVAGGLVASVDGSKTMTTDAEVYDPGSNTWVTAGALPVAVGAAATAVLPSGQVLVMGGAPDPNSNAQVRQAAMYTPYTAPSKPLAVSAAASTNSALVTFAPPASNGGLQIQRYTVIASSGQRVSTSDARTAVTVTGLTAGRPVTFTVVAVNAVGVGATSEPSNPVTPTAPPRPPDPAPKVTLGQLKTQVKLSAFLKGVRFTVTPSRTAALQVSLIGAVNRATIARAYSLTLASTRLGPSARQRTVTLKPSKALVGRPRSATVQLVIVATGAGGARSTTTRRIHVSR